eukprot:364213-Chlamydomonas_euryale.AAC.15
MRSSEPRGAERQQRAIHPRHAADSPKARLWSPWSIHSVATLHSAPWDEPKTAGEGGRRAGRWVLLVPTGPESQAKSNECGPMRRCGRNNLLPHVRTRKRKTPVPSPATTGRTHPRRSVVAARRDRKLSTHGFIACVLKSPGHSCRSGQSTLPVAACASRIGCSEQPGRTAILSPAAAAFGVCSSGSDSCKGGSYSSCVDGGGMHVSVKRKPGTGAPAPGRGRNPAFLVALAGVAIVCAGVGFFAGACFSVHAHA